MDEPREPRDGDRSDSPASKGEGRLRVLPPVPGSEAPPPASSSDEPIVDYPPLTDDLRRSAAELEVRLFAHATDHPECRAAFVLLMALEIWRRGGATKKLDAVAMGLFGLQYFLDDTPPDRDVIGLRFVEAPNGGVRVEPYMKKETNPVPPLRLVPSVAPVEDHAPTTGLDSPR